MYKKGEINLEDISNEELEKLVVNNKNEYFMWLKNKRGLEEKTINTYRSNLKRFGDIFSNSDYVYIANSEEEVNSMLKLFSTNKELKEKNQKEHNGYSSALNRYKEYIIERNINMNENNNFFIFTFESV